MLLRSSCPVQEVEDFRGSSRLAELGEDALDAVVVGGGVAVGHGVGGEDDVVAVVVGRAGGGLDADAGGDTGQYDLGDPELSEVGVEGGVVKGPPTPLGHQV